jgi:predicted O-linked N-acetylglucosamine transferase (SPINDLY family)
MMLKVLRALAGGQPPFAIDAALLREVLQTVAAHDRKFFLIMELGINLSERGLDTFSDAELHKKMLSYRGKTPLFEHFANTATYFTNGGHHGLATRLYREILKHRPDKKTHSLLLQNLLMWEGSDHESLLEAHKEWAGLYCAGIKPLSVHWRAADPGRKIRVGYTCHFFAAGVSNNALIPMLERHDRSKFEIYCYDDGETAKQYQGVADCWRDIRGMSDEQVAKLMAKDGIDILQEMNGHCAINRMGVVAHRPAPIQINWYNHASTTAIPGMTHITIDNVSVLDADLPFYTEKLHRIGHFFGAVNLHGQFEGLNPEPPFRDKGYITFANLGSPHKHTAATIRLWSEVLKAVPSAKMLIKGGPLQFESYRESFYQLFEANGVPRSRILTETHSPHADMVHSFNRADIMLDTFPVTGGSTLFEALWNGVPPISLRGKRWISRIGASILTTLGNTELIAETPEEYVQKALGLASDPERVAAYRRDLRPRMAKSCLTDPDNYRKDVEAAYLAMWEEWCGARQQAA